VEALPATPLSVRNIFIEKDFFNFYMKTIFLYENNISLKHHFFAASCRADGHRAANNQAARKRHFRKVG
jgi:hypothetical protein